METPIPSSEDSSVSMNSFVTSIGHMSSIISGAHDQIRQLEEELSQKDQEIEKLTEQLRILELQNTSLAQEKKASEDQNNAFRSLNTNLRARLELETKKQEKLTRSLDMTAKKEMSTENELASVFAQTMEDTIHNVEKVELLEEENSSLHSKIRILREILGLESLETNETSEQTYERKRNIFIKFAAFCILPKDSKIQQFIQGELCDLLENYPRFCLERIDTFNVSITILMSMVRDVEFLEKIRNIVGSELYIQSFSPSLPENTQ